MAKKLTAALPPIKIIKCRDSEEAMAIEQMLNEGEINVGVNVSVAYVQLDQSEAAKPYGEKVISRIVDAAKALRKLRRALEKHNDEPATA